MKIINVIKKNRTILAAFIITETLILISLHWYTHQRIQEYLDDITQRTKSEYQVILNAYAEKAAIAFETIINTAHIKSLFSKAHYLGQHKQQNLRRQLYRLLYPKYKILRQFGFQQLHFHTPDNYSFLRMHAPHLFGDDLSSFRKTVVYVNTTHMRVSGFEEGIASNGYRFVFPLFSNNKYLGSVELSFSAYSLIEFMRQEFLDTHFIIAKQAIKQTNQNYIPSVLDNHFMVKKAHYKTDQALKPQQSLALFNYPDAFSISDQDRILTFIPVKNPISNQIKAYLIISSSGKYLIQIRNNLWLLFTGLSIIVTLLYLRYIRNKKFQQKINEEHQKLERANKKLKTILNNQKNLVIITDKDQMTDVNARVLEFFGYENFEQLIKNHTCICDFFIQHKDYFHLGRVPPQSHWIEYLQNLPSHQRIVTMVGTDMEARAFQVNITEYADYDSSIITLTDITEMFIRQKILKYKAQHDRLTDIYNRQKIDEVLEKICGYVGKRQEKVGIILFDIDHFKSINDTYGHHIGDEVLKMIATLVKSSIREDDIFGRWGGEEFILILKHTNLDNTVKKAYMLKDEIAAIKHSDIPSVTASFGVTEVIPNDTPQVLLKRVDHALYKAKHEGRNRVIVSQINHSKLLQSK